MTESASQKEKSVTPDRSQQETFQSESIAPTEFALTPLSIITPVVPSSAIGTNPAPDVSPIKK